MYFKEENMYLKPKRRSMPSKTYENVSIEYDDDVMEYEKSTPKNSKKERSTIDILLSIEDKLTTIINKMNGKSDLSGSISEAFSDMKVPANSAFMQSFAPETPETPISQTKSPTAKGSILEEIQSVLAQTASEGGDGNNVVSTVGTLQNYDDDVPVLK